MLKTRTITAAVLIVAFIAALFLSSSALFALIVAFVVAAAAWEWSRLCGVVHEHFQTAFAALVGILSLIALYLPYDPVFMRWLLLLGFVYWLVVLFMLYLVPVKHPVTQSDGVALLGGIFILLIAAIAIQYLRGYAPKASAWLLLYALSIVWTMDTGAYFAGKRFGKTRLAPLISPGKTWEGVFGGLIATLLVMLVVLLVADWATGDRLKLIAATVLTAAASVFGDLYESRMKRSAGRKDSSAMLPGHGGVLDRIDGVLSAIPVFAFVWAWL